MLYRHTMTDHKINIALYLLLLIYSTMNLILNNKCIVRHLLDQHVYTFFLTSESRSDYFYFIGNISIPQYPINKRNEHRIFILLPILK